MPSLNKNKSLGQEEHLWELTLTFEVLYINKNKLYAGLSNTAKMYDTSNVKVIFISKHVT